MLQIGVSEKPQALPAVFFCFMAAGLAQKEAAVHC
jgi:hypothetical protein